MEKLLAEIPEIYNKAPSSRGAIGGADWCFGLLLCLIFCNFVGPIGSLLSTRDLAVDADFLPRAVQLCKPEPWEFISYISGVIFITVASVFWLVLLRPALFENHTFTGNKSTGNRKLQVIGVMAQLAILALIVFELKDDIDGGLRCCLKGVFLVGCVAVAYLLLRHNRPTWVSILKTTEVSRFLVLTIVLLYTSFRLLPSIALDANHYNFMAASHVSTTMEEFSAILDGNTNLVNFFPQYDRVLNYLLCPVFRLVGMSLLSYTATMSLLTLVAMLEVFFIFKSVTQKYWSALICYIPFCAVSFYPLWVDKSHFYYTFANYFAAMPLRYFGPITVAALLTNYLRNTNGIGLVALTLVSSLVALNNLDFGVPAFGSATLVVAIHEFSREYSRKQGDLQSSFTGALRLVSRFLLSFAFTALLMVAFTYVRSGQLPVWAEIGGFQRMFVLNGFQMLPMPLIGLHYVIFGYYALSLYTYLSIILATFSSPCNEFSDHERVLQGAFLFSTLFGLGTGLYYVGRSHEQVLGILLCSWALNFVLLVLVAISFLDVPRSIACFSEKPIWFIPSIVLIITSLILVGNSFSGPTLSFEISRLRNSQDSFRLDMKDVANFVSERVSDRQVGIIHQVGHSIAAHAHLKNVFPYGNQVLVYTHSQMTRYMRTLHEQKVRDIFLEVDHDCVAGADGELFRQYFRANGYNYIDRYGGPKSSDLLFGPVEHWRFQERPRPL